MRNHSIVVTDSIPKIELHVHLEGTMSPALVAQLARRNQLSLPAQLDLTTNTIYWRDLFDFFSVFDACSNVIRTPDDITEVTYTYLADAARCGTLYVEITASPQNVIQNGIDYVTNRDAIIKGIERANRDFGIEARIIMVLVRHYDHQECLEVVKNAVAFPSPYVVGIGLAGDERNNGPEHFIEAFALARQHGLHCTAHAGEAYGPDSIRDSINLLQVTRIGHGLQTIYDASLIELVKRKNIHLELCLSSNIQTKAMDSYIPPHTPKHRHPARDFYDLGLSISFSTDDPPYFQTNMTQEYDIAMQQFGFTPTELLSVSRNAIIASFAEEALKRKLLAKLG